MATNESGAAKDADLTDPALLLVEEELRVGKHEVVTDRVRVRTINEVAEEFVRENLKGERVEV